MIYIRAAANLFRRRGWTAIINDDIISNAIFLCHVFVGTLCAVLANGYAILNSLAAVNSMILITLGYLAGHMMCNVMLKVLSSSVTAVFVNFAERPELFEVRNEFHASCYT